MRPYNSAQISIRCKVLMCCIHKVENFCKLKIQHSAFSAITVCDQSNGFQIYSTLAGSPGTNQLMSYEALRLTV